MLGTLASTLVWLLLAASLVVVGWNEPLSYKFMSQAQIAQAERALQPPPPPPQQKHAADPYTFNSGDKALGQVPGLNQSSSSAAGNSRSGGNSGHRSGSGMGH